MKAPMILLFCVASTCAGQTILPTARVEAEYYVELYAKHYRVPIALVRAIIKYESNWRSCALSSKGAVGLMQLMPATAQRMGVVDQCSLDQNIAAGVRDLACLMQRFHNDFRLVVAAYYVGEGRIAKRGLSYRNPDVVTYVERIRSAYLRESRIETGKAINAAVKRDVR